METLTFRTNIKCSGCVDTITPFLNEDNSIENWQVDLQSPERILKVETSSSPEDIKRIMKNAGYTAEEIA